MYTQAIHESTGLSESRMIARIVPPAAPTTMVTKVSSIVSASARSVRGLNMYSKTVGQSTFGLLMNEKMSAIAR